MNDSPDEAGRVWIGESLLTVKAASLDLVNILPDGKFVLTKRGEEMALRIFREMEDFESVVVYALCVAAHDSVGKK